MSVAGSMVKKICCAGVLVSVSFLLFGQHAVARSKPFAFPTRLVQKQSPADCSMLNTPIDENRRITVGADGHLVCAGGRVRIFGTNISAIPEKEDAAYWAQVLSSQGFNGIRFHHLDSSWANGFLTRDAAGHQVFNEKKLDDFDYFFAALKQVGIYADLNLLTGRDMNSSDGLPKELDALDWKERHAYGFWSEQGLLAQQWYARTLLSHRNPYTGLTYAEDPAVAFSEINNENGLLQSYLCGTVDKYAPSCLVELEDKWNVWLSERHDSLSSLSAEFNSTQKKGASLVTSRSDWQIETHDGAAATLNTNGGKLLVKVQKNGAQSWHVQLNQGSWALHEGTVYTLSFRARASKKTQCALFVMMNHDPWSNLNLNRSIALGTEWQQYSFTVSNFTSDAKARLTFGDMGFAAGTTFEFADVSLCEGGTVAVVTEGMRPGSVALLPFHEYGAAPAEYRLRYLQFLYDTERAYWRSMRSYLKQTLGVRALLFGTIVSTSTPGIMQEFDIIDSHAYWYHPSFPLRSWDMRHYFVENQNLASSPTGGTLTELAVQRIYGKPFSVSEYDHPYPNQYSAEMLPMLSTYACLQDWDCIFTFAYEIGQKGDGVPVKIAGYFDQADNPAKAAAAPVAARIFRQQLVSPAKAAVYLPVTRRSEYEQLSDSRAWFTIPGGLRELSRECAMVHRVGSVWGETEGDCKAALAALGSSFLSINETADEESALVQQIDSGRGVTSDTGELFWNPKLNEYVVCAAGAFVSVADGSSSNQKVRRNESLWDGSALNLPVYACFKPEDDFAVVAGATYAPDAYLVFSCSWSGNTNEHLRLYGTPSVRGGPPFAVIRTPMSLTTDFTLGTAPALALSCEGTLTVQSVALRKCDSQRDTSSAYFQCLYRLTKLNSDGTRGDAVLGSETNLSLHQTSFSLSRADDTLWYELTVIRPQN